MFSIQSNWCLLSTIVILLLFLSLKEWLGKQAERERERDEKRQERIARRRAMPNHKFDDPLYDQQKSLLAENQEDALQAG